MTKIPTFSQKYALFSHCTKRFARTVLHTNFVVLMKIDTFK